ncbi:Thioesterase/thiol ester dehydrase-isomerase [Patellaria atrata CBS 101060]|uniref:Thioesterase/thiol ester dehydrase-isomerase n=1 Tax=Patellaria atrata CBS 101060 TaxID=1346257 RepID=A0A9P4VTG5_9PEZI|nr:Thioesterase/thiol ester dehydrase-isomerase [Patellaria atrata CBS 101060]
MTEYPPQEVSWLKRDVLLFANSIGCKADELHFLYELHPSFSVFPTYPIILPFKHTSTEVVDFHAAQASSTTPPIPGLPKLDSTRVLDGERNITIYRPLPVSSTGKKFELRTKIVGAYDKGNATVLETEHKLTDASTGDVYSKAVGSAFYVGQGKWGGPRGPKAPSYPPPKDKSPDATYTLQTTDETALLYRLNGDYNPLHADPAPGRKMGFGGPIVHGLCSWNVAAHAVLRALGGGDPENLREHGARFASPVKPGDKLEVQMWVGGRVEVEE